MATGDDAASYDSSSSASSEDKVLISRKKLQMKQRERESKHDDASSSTATASTTAATPSSSSSYKGSGASSKSDHICGVCEKEGDDLYVCTGSCMGAFHLACLPPSIINNADAKAVPKDQWKCHHCVSNTHVCFHCKQLGFANINTDAIDITTGSNINTSDHKTDTDAAQLKIKPVVKCRALSCGKFYHQECIATLPLARIAGARFICPLHTCSACEQSGGNKKEPVRCMRCPVAYHSSCLPGNGVGVVHLPGSRIICPKHAGAVEGVKRETEEEQEEGAVEEGTTSKQTPVMKRDAEDGDGGRADAEGTSPRTEENDDAQSDSSAKEKKASKKEKKDKKKKKKKRKKEKKKEKERHKGTGEEDDEKEEQSEKKSKATPSNIPRVKSEQPSTSGDEVGDAVDREEGEELEEEKPDAILETVEPKPETPAEPEFVATVTSHDVKDEAHEPADTSANQESSVETTVSDEPLTVKAPEVAEEAADDGSPTTPHESAAEAVPGSASDDQIEVTGGDDHDGEGAEVGTSASEPAKERQSSMIRSKKSKKKKQKGRGVDDGNVEPRADEAKWVQCDECKKWRIVPKEVDLDAMPEKWYCTMNTWNKALASCAVPEEVVEAKRDRSVKRTSGTISADTAGVAVSGTPATKKLKSNKQATVPDEKAVDTSAKTTDAIALDKVKSGKQVKKTEKDSKKRKLKLKLKEKYGEVKWVQCEDVHCGKWRVVPLSIDFDLLPSVWYCHLNTWSPELASCNATNPPEVEAYLSKSQSKKRPAKRLRGPDGDVQAASASSQSSGSQQVAIEGAQTKSGHAKPTKGSKTSTPTAHGVGAVGASANTPSFTSAGGNTSACVDDGRGKKLVGLGGVKSVVLEWAQCEKCNKWRKLPAHIKSSTLPDKWYCVMNHWDPSRASCAMPQEEDQEPVDASPLPSSQNWYPMPGQVGPTTAGGASVRSKRGKLSYSELLYASTGQLRKTYTSESSTLSFEYEGMTYYRDDQYKNSSLYASPLTTNKLTGERIEPTSEAAKVKAVAPKPLPTNAAQQQLLERVSELILAKVDLRREYAITEIVDSVLMESTTELSLSAITTALAQLVSSGAIEKVDRHTSTARGEDDDSDRSALTSTTVLLRRSLSSQAAYYRRVPKRPLKALKAWKIECK